MAFDFNSYKNLVTFLGKFLGDETEVALYDFSDLNCSVIAVENSHIGGTHLGDPLTGFALSKLKDKGTDIPPYYMDYPTFSKTGKTLRSGCFFILNPKGEPQGLIHLSMDVSKLQEATAILQKLSHIAPPLDSQTKSESPQELLHPSPEEMIIHYIQEVCGNKDVSPSRMTKDEKMKVVAKLEDDKFFLLKGAIALTASHLAVSEATAYRYLSDLRKTM